MLEVKSLTKIFGDKKAVNNISFNLEKGKIFGLLGRNGAGKSTIFRCILNIITNYEGKIIYNDEKITDKITDKIGYLPEEGSLILEYNVLELCIYYGALKSMKELQVKKELFKWLQEFDMVQYMNTKIKDMSKGNRQKIQFIISILHNPDLIILDEPFSGLDPVSVEELKKVIINLKETGKSIIFSSHRMDHVEMLCDDILLIDKGNEIISGNLNEIKKEYGKKRINIIGNIDENIISKIPGVENIDKISIDEYIVKITNEECIKDILDKIKNYKILKFSLIDVSLNDIFIEKVGKSYEE